MVVWRGIGVRRIEVSTEVSVTSVCGAFSRGGAVDASIKVKTLRWVDGWSVVERGLERGLERGRVLLDLRREEIIQVSPHILATTKTK